MKTQIYEMENSGFSGVRWIRTQKTVRKFIIFKKKVNTGVTGNTAKLTEGLCFGYSTIWATDMASGKSIDEAAPTQLRAGLLQQKVEMITDKKGWDQAVTSCLSDLGHSMEQKLSVPWKQVADRLGFEEGFFLVDIGIHWVAMGRRNGTFYFFDANEGLFSYSSHFSFRTDVNSDENFGWYADNNWMTNAGGVCNCYKVGAG